jgi:hypothetical protein
VGHDGTVGAKESMKSFIVAASGPWFCDEAESIGSVSVEGPEHRISWDKWWSTTVVIDVCAGDSYPCTGESASISARADRELLGAGELVGESASGLCLVVWCSTESPWESMPSTPPVFARSPPLGTCIAPVETKFSAALEEGSIHT